MLQQRTIVRFLICFLVVLTISNEITRGQSLTLSELNILPNKSVDEIGDFLLDKNWKYGDHISPDSTGDEKVSWTYFFENNKDYPKAFFTVHMKHKSIIGIDYQFMNASEYKNLLTSIKNAGYKKDTAYFEKNQMRVVYLGKEFFYTTVNVPNSQTNCPFGIMIFKNQY